MRVPETNNINFKSKNSFLSLSKNAKTVSEKIYWKSQNYEAKARLQNLKLKKAYQEFDRITFSNTLSSDFALLKVIPIILYRKLQISRYQSLVQKLKTQNK